MDKKPRTQSWVGNMYQRFNAVCHEVDEYVNKETIKNLENHMQRVGESVKKFYSDVVQDIILPPLVETRKSPVFAIKDNNKISDKANQETILEENLINKISDKTIQVHLNSSTSNQEIVLEQKPCEDFTSPENKNSSEEFTKGECINGKFLDDNEKISSESSENFLDNTSSNNDDSVFEDANWGIENIIDLDNEEKIQFLEEKMFKLPVISYDSSSPHYFSASSYDISSCGSSTALDHDNNNNDYTRFAFSDNALYGETTQTDEEDGSIVDFEDLNIDSINLTDKKELVESCVIVEGEKVFSFPYRSTRSKSYKKIIKDAFMSRKRLTKEYKQLAIWCGDIEKDFDKKTEENPPQNLQLEDFQDSEWELL